MSAFDPAQTGDPLGPGQSMPAIGYGGTHVGGPAGSQDPRRRPIGFAPPEDEPRFRTEISFKRHHEPPRASVGPDQSGGGSTPPWHTPERAPSATEGEPYAPPSAAAGDEEEEAVQGDAEASVGGEEQAAKESVPFYKREISFRRKLATPHETTHAVAADEIEASDRPVQGEDHEVAADVSGVDGRQDVPVEPTADEATAEVAAEDDSEPTTEDDFEPTADDDPAQVAGAVEPARVAASVDAAELDVPAVHNDPSVDDAPPPPAGGDTSRWNKRTTKRAVRRQPARGAKGRKVVGLKIGASQIAAAVVTETDGGHELVQLARRPLAAGIVVDGEVRDQDALANALKAFFDEEQLPKKDVRIGLASNRIGVRTFDIVGIDDEARFDNAVRFKAHEVLPVAVHEAVLDYRVLEQRPNEAGEQMRRVLLVVAPQDQVEPYQRVADRAGLKLTGIDLEALGLLRTFVEPKPFAARLADDTATVVVAIGHESSTLLVAGGGACEFTRVFDWGGGALQNAIAQSLDVQPAEATTILRHLSLSGPGRRYEALDDVRRAKATEAVRLGLTPFARELVNSLQFYQTQAESLGIGGIVITGGTSHLEGIDQALHAMIGVAVSVGDPLTRVSHAGRFDPAIEAVIGSMAVPIGLAIDDSLSRSVNLLREDAVKPRSRRSSMIAIGAPVAVVVPLVALGLLYFGAHGKVVDQQTELNAIRGEIAALPLPQVPRIDSRVVGDEAVRATAVASVLGGRLAWDAVLRDLARVLPANVWLTKLSVSQPQATNLADGATAQVAAAVPGQAATPTAVSIDGFTYSQPDVARLLARLATLPSLRTVTLNSSQTDLVAGKAVTHFVIVADLNQTGGSS